MANQTNRGGMKSGTAAGAESKKHMGVRPGSTTQNKTQRQRPVQRGAKKNRVVNESKPASEDTRRQS